MSIALSPEIERLIDERVRSGRYRSPEELVTAAVSILDQYQRLTDLSAEDLDLLYPGFREKIAQGLAEADAGRLTDGEEFFTELEREEQELPDRTRRTA